MAVRIAVVDDDDSLVFMLKESLSSDGFDIVTASDGVAALSLVRSEKPQLLVIDAHMPGMTGQEVLASLRADATTATLPVILLTGDAPEKAFPSGRDVKTHVMTKPIELDDLTHLVRKMLL